ncbi:1071_t:CDS:10 [Ambispora leptoticha]|uniref:1071_t:CDS:1 n=1 Tax=Ambispora leptoticha TaxID=144679 RepID=A0A9N8VVF7_9GLOM|nr:1071_t:CDS:10 [Ambispora leptoticha]
MLSKLYGHEKKTIDRLKDYPYYFSAQKRLNWLLNQPERNDVQKDVLISEPIKAINLKKRGKVNYLTGENGFGKSTIISLVMEKIAYAEHENLVENGLSTGQKQLTDLNNLFTNSEGKEIFIFDEADNALDENNKKEFREKIEGISKKKLVILIRYLNLLKMIIENGETRLDRTGVGTKALFGCQTRFDLRDTNIRYLVDNGVNIWNEWPYEKFKLSENYQGETVKEFVEKIRVDKEFAKKHGNLGPVYGVPFNIASYSLLVTMIAQQVKEQLKREPKKLPILKLNPEIKSLFDFAFEDISLENYEPHPPIKGKGYIRREMDLGLKRVKMACRLLGHPEKKQRTVHITGTNGKGSTTAFLASVLKNSGLRVDPVDLVIYEVGLGGEHDATNVILPLVSIITNIDYDHFRYLGNKLEEEHLSVTYLQNYFASQEEQYKEKLLNEMQEIIENSPLVVQLKEENNALKSFIEGYKLGKEFVKPVQKGQEFEDYVHEKLQEIFSGSDIIENVTHARTSAGTRADILQIVRDGSDQEKVIGRIVYEVKNTEK